MKKWTKTEKKWKIKSKKNKLTGEKKSRKKRKRGPKGYISRDGWAQTLVFYMRIVTRNRNEIEAPKNQILSTQQRKRKWKQIKENERMKEMKNEKNEKIVEKCRIKKITKNNDGDTRKIFDDFQCLPLLL